MSQPLHWPSLMVALLIMLGGTVYPWWMTQHDGRPDHAVATALLMAMSAGFVRGVGFVPEARLWRWVFSQWACLGWLLVALGLKLAQ